MVQAAPWWWSLCGAQQTRYSKTRKAVGARVGGRSVRSRYSLGFHLPQGPPKAAQTPEAEACGVGEGKQGLQGPPCPRLPSYPKLPKPRLAHLTKGRAAKGCCLDQMAVFVDVDQVLAEGPAPGHVDYGHTVLQQKPRDQVRPWCPLHLPGHVRMEAHPGGVGKGHFRQAHGQVFLPGAHSHHQGSSRREEGFKPRATAGEEAEGQPSRLSLLVLPLTLAACPDPWQSPTCTAASAGAAGWGWGRGQVLQPWGADRARHGR